MTAGVGAEGLAFAAGFAASHALQPEAALIAQDAWRAAQLRRLDPEFAAQAAAEGLASQDAMATEASYSGIDASRFAYLYGIALNAPGTGELLEMLRRKTITPGNFTHGLRKARLEPMWDDPLTELQHARLSPAQVALGIVRSVISDPGLLATQLDVSGGVVPAYPVWPGDALTEAEAGGIDKDRLRVMVGEIGLPMSAQQAASAYFRNIIHLPDFNRAILEGDTRPEWAPFILDQARQILTSGQYAELQLRGYYDRATRLKNTAKHGMSDQDSDWLYDVLGRSIPVHQITTGEARGGTYNGPSADIPAAYLHSLQRGNLRPEYYNLAYANRYSYPSAFVVRALLTDGALTQAEGEQIFLDVGWTPDLAHKVAQHYAPSTAVKADPHLTKASNQLWTTLHRSYVSEETDDTVATQTLTTLGVDPTVIPDVLALWQAERALIRKQLSAAQVKKAYAEAVTNPDTGTAWTHTDAIDALIQRGYSMADATTMLEL